MKKLKIKDKIELENKIDSFLKSNIPISLFTELYDLSYPQMRLFLNRLYGYERQMSAMDEIVGYSDSHPDENLFITHNIDELNPFSALDQRDTLLRYNELKGLIPHSIEKRINELKEKLKEYDMYLEKFQNISLFLEEQEKIISENEAMSLSQFPNLFFKYNLNLEEIKALEEKYASYSALKLQLKNEEDNLRKAEENFKIYKKEFDLLKETLVKRNIKLVNWCIRTFFNGIPLPKEDTQMVGITGLLDAIEHFDCNKTYKTELGTTEYYKFSTYAVPTIVHHIQREFSNLYGIKWDDYIKKEAIKHYRSLIMEEDPSKKIVTAQELSDLGLLNLSIKQIEGLESVPDHVIPFSSEYAKEEDEFLERTSQRQDYFVYTPTDYEAFDRYQDSTQVQSGLSVEEAVFLDDLKNNLKEVLDTLTEREKNILILRFGLDGTHTKSLEEVAQIVGVTRERIRQIEAKAIRKLRHPSRAKKLRVYYETNDSSYYWDAINKNKYFKSNLYLQLLKMYGLNISLEAQLKFLSMHDIDIDLETLKEELEVLEDIITIAKTTEPYLIAPVIYETLKFHISDEFRDFLTNKYGVSSEEKKKI